MNLDNSGTVCVPTACISGKLLYMLSSGIDSYPPVLFIAPSVCTVASLLLLAMDLTDALEIANGFVNPRAAMFLLTDGKKSSIKKISITIPTPSTGIQIRLLSGSASVGMICVALVIVLAVEPSS